MNALIVDALASGKGTRKTTRDVIGAGPRTVAGVLEAHGVETLITPVERYLSKPGTGYDVLLVSGMTSDMQALQKTVKTWRRQGGGPVVLGGPAAGEPERALRKTGADIAVIGAGEESLSQLLELGIQDAGEDELASVKSVAYRTRGGVRVNPLRPVQGREIFTMYRPSTRRVTDYPLYYAARVYVEAVRGCSNYHRARLGPLGETCTYCERCTETGLTERYDCPAGIPPGCGYCSVPSLYGPPKSRPAKLIREEVRELLDLGVHRVVLSAPGFLDYGRDMLVEPEPLTDPRSPEPNYEAVEELLHGLTALPQVADGDASIMLENIKAALVTERAAELLGAYLGGTPINVGFETGSDEHSLMLGRPDTPSETLVALRRLKRSGLKPYVYFIHGLPGQTEETVDATVDMIKRSMRSGSERVILYRFQSLPRSAFAGCPSGPPAAKDSLSHRIYAAAQEANKSSKEAQVGHVVRVVVAERYDRDHRLYVAYPLRHGPVVLLEGFRGDVGDVLDVRITGVASDRMVTAAA
ncbi:B12-binding domain-containing radical SAM protein [Candidatus Bathyarchaeota archaeon]|nr:B12-binding domain-containing radical SAM protein [Candidatus Bathyarchaeota archaeon]